MYSLLYVPRSSSYNNESFWLVCNDYYYCVLYIFKNIYINHAKRTHEKAKQMRGAIKTIFYYYFLPCSKESLASCSEQNHYTQQQQVKKNSRKEEKFSSVVVWGARNEISLSLSPTRYLYKGLFFSGSGLFEIPVFCASVLLVQFI